MGGLFSSEPVQYPQYNYDSYNNIHAYSPSRNSSTLITRPSAPRRTTNANPFSSGGTLNSCRSGGYTNRIRSSDELGFGSNTYSAGQQHFSGETVEYSGCYSNSRSIGIRSSDCLDYNYSRSIGIRSSDCLDYDYSSHTYSPRKRISTSPSTHLSKVVASKLNWANQDGEVLKIRLQNTDAEYIQILNLFNKTTDKRNHVITQIERVQNPYLMGRYEMKKSELEKRAGFVEEKLLFHGTKVQNIASICQDNLNWRMHGKGTGHRYGQGVSFSPKSYYSSFYCDKRTHDKVMIVAKVIMANQIVGDKNMVIPPYMYFSKTISYDTSVKEDGSVIVKYCDDEFYPAYIIHFYAKVLNNHKKNKFNQSESILLN